MHPEIQFTNESCFSYLGRIESNSIDLVLIDPPYEVSQETNFRSGKAKGKDTDRFRVSMNFLEWDFGFAEFGEIVKELYRVLKRRGLLFAFMIYGKFQS